mmetsp:Transcript_18405/g.44463  ORF Transcript_18405/g.44463 Transcript_18405/m.44463 type:complete len:316 (+) Transcript_18405:141-1088(+)
MSVLSVILSVFWTVFILLEVLICLAAVASVVQERKIWQNPKLPSMTFHGMLKCYILNVFWMSCCLVGAVLTLIEAVITFKFSNTRQFAHATIERMCAQYACRLFVGPVEIRGGENLPAEFPGSPAPVYIANHDSQIDTACVYFLNRQWRWVAKSSVMLLPGVGQTMYLSDHVFIDRVKKKDPPPETSTSKQQPGGNSVKQSLGAKALYIKSNKSVQEGVPMFFFPQGTRRLGERLPFKKGAFNIAMENESLLVPVSIEIPLTAWNSSYPFGKCDPVVLTIHKPIRTKGRKDDMDGLMKESFDTIYSVLPDYTKKE